MKLSILAVARCRRCCGALPVLLLGVVLGCRDDEAEPTAPAEAMPSQVEAAAALSLNQVSAGWSHGCGINANNRAFCWGQNLFGQLGDGTNTDHDLPVAVTTTQRFRLLDAGFFTTCAVTTEDRLFCWGAGFSTQPQAVGGSRRFRNVDAGLDHVCAVGRDDGRAYCWGDNRWGQLGDGTTTSHSTPAPVAGTRRFKQVATG